MTSYVNETGIYLDTFSEIKESLISDLQAIFGGGVNSDNSARFGQLINIICERIADQNELIQLVANSQDPTSAIGVWLEQLVRVNGIDKNEAEFSTVTVELTAGSAADAPIIAGDQVEDSAVGEPFAIDENVTVPAGTSVVVSATAINPGQIPMASGRSLTIKNPRYSWMGAESTADAVLGALEETSADLRIRRQLAANQTGNSSPSAIHRKLADLDNVTEVKIIHNTDDATDPETGVPAHSLWAILVGGTDSEIAQMLFENVGAGVGLYGGVGGIPYDYSDPVTGDIWPILWSSGSEVPIYISVITKKSAGYPGDGDSQIKRNIVDYFRGDFSINGVSLNGFGLSDDVVSSRIYTPANIVPNHTIVSINISRSPNPTSSGTIEIAPDEYADTEIANITVTNQP